MRSNMSASAALLRAAVYPGRQLARPALPHWRGRGIAYRRHNGRAVWWDVAAQAPCQLPPPDEYLGGWDSLTIEEYLAEVAALGEQAAPAAPAAAGPGGGVAAGQPATAGDLDDPRADWVFAPTDPTPTPTPTPESSS